MSIHIDVSPQEIADVKSLYDTAESDAWAETIAQYRKLVVQKDRELVEQRRRIASLLHQLDDALAKIPRGESP